MMDSKLTAAAILLLISLVCVSGVALAGGDSTSGSFTFTVSGYTVTGDLTAAAVAHGGAVQMLMTIDQSLSTSYGTVHITGSGVWSGETNFHDVNGVIGNLGGTIQVCALFYCQTGEFTGTGTWSGTLTWSSSSGSDGSGTFQGTLNISGLSTQNGPVAISGSWVSTFKA